MQLQIVLVWLTALVGHVGMTHQAMAQLGLLYRQAVAAGVQAMACAYGVVDGDSVTIAGIGPAVVRQANARSVLAADPPCPPGIVALVRVHLPAPGYEPCNDGPDDLAFLARQEPPRPVDVIVCGIERPQAGPALRSSP